MGRVLSVVLAVECDCERCGKQTRFTALTWREAQDDAKRSGWIIHSDGQTFCSPACDEVGHVKRPSRFLPGDRRRGKRSSSQSTR